MEFKKDIENPYLILFTAGIICGLVGVLLWTLFSFHILNFYPRQAHATLMFSGFLWAFVAGFLMTAVPRMTQAGFAKLWEVLTAVALVAMTLLITLRQETQMLVGVLTLQSLFLFYFILKRFLISRRIPFEGFLFVPFAFTHLFYGLLLFIQGNLGLFFLHSGEAFILNLISGVGSRLIPVILRVPQAINPDQTTVHKKYGEYFLFALFLNSTFLIQDFYSIQIGLFLRAFFIFVYSITHFKILKIPSSVTFNGWGLKISSLFLFLGYFFAGVFPEYQLSFLHLSYIGGFSLITLMIATRVCLAHSGAGTEYELSGKVVGPTLFFLLFSAIFRAASFSNPSSIFILISAILFFLATTMWYFLIARKKT